MEEISRLPAAAPVARTPHRDAGEERGTRRGARLVAAALFCAVLTSRVLRHVSHCAAIGPERAIRASDACARRSAARQPAPVVVPDPPVRASASDATRSPRIEVKRTVASPRLPPRVYWRPAAGVAPTLRMFKFNTCTGSYLGAASVTALELERPYSLDKKVAANPTPRIRVQRTVVRRAHDSLASRKHPHRNRGSSFGNGGVARLRPPIKRESRPHYHTGPMRVVSAAAGASGCPCTTTKPQSRRHPCEGAWVDSCALSGAATCDSALKRVAAPTGDRASPRRRRRPSPRRNRSTAPMPLSGRLATPRSLHGGTKSPFPIPCGLGAYTTDWLSD